MQALSNSSPRSRITPTTGTPPTGAQHNITGSTNNSSEYGFNIKKSPSDDNTSSFISSSSSSVEEKPKTTTSDKSVQSTTNLFDKKLPSAIKITNVEQAKKLFASKLKEGFRWITPGFIYAGYRVGTTNKQITSAEELNGYDVLVCNKTYTDQDNEYQRIYYLEESTGKLHDNYILGQSSTECIKNFLDENYGNEFLIESPFKVITPVIAKARQTPTLKEGDWVVMEGKTMRLESKSQVIEITDIEQAKELIKNKIKEGFRWKIPGSNNDDDLFNIAEYTGYQVKVTYNPNPSLDDLKGCDVLFCNREDGIEIHYQHNVNQDQLYTRAIFERYIKAPASLEEVKQFLDENYGNGFQIKTTNPLTQALQIPEIKKGEWLIIEGTTMCIKKTPPLQVIEITDIEQAIELIKDKINNGFRWVTEYRVGETNKKITLSEELNGYDVLVHEEKPKDEADLEYTEISQLEEGDWVVIEGKKMSLVKANEQEFQSSKGLVESMSKLGLKEEEATVSKLPGVRLPKELFHDSYARMAGAYIRRLERFKYLEQVFEKFFQTQEVNQNISVYLYSDTLQSPRKEVTTPYSKYSKVTLSPNSITEGDLELIHKALGIKVEPEKLKEITPPTFANIIPFKKVLEVLTCYDPKLCIPMLVSFEVGNDKAEFLISPYAKRPLQVIVSVSESNDIYGNRSFKGNAYKWWMYSVSAQKAWSILKRPLSKTTSITEKMLEFLACTQIAESHFTPGKLRDSRVPGSGKLARAIIKRHKTSGEPIAPSFDAGSETAFPMAYDGGTQNGRDAVNSLRRNGGTRAANTYAYDMSDDSDAEWD